MVEQSHGLLFSFLFPIAHTTFAILLQLPPFLSSDLRTYIIRAGTSPPLPSTVRAFILIARRIQHFLPSSTRVESCIHTLLGATGWFELNPTRLARVGSPRRILERGLEIWHTCFVSPC